MSRSSTVARNDYTGNGSTATYSFTFKIYSTADLRVVKRDTSNAETPLVLTTDYTVSGTGNDSGGTITLVGGNLPTNYHLAILNKAAITQTTSIRNQGAFYPEIHEDTFDRIVMIEQQLAEYLSRAVTLPETLKSTDFYPKFAPSIVGAISKVPLTNSSGNGWADPSTWPSTTDFAAAITAAANALASAAAAAASAAAAGTSATNAATSATGASTSAGAAAASAAAAAISAAQAGTGVLLSGSRAAPNSTSAGVAIQVSNTAYELHNYVAGNGGAVTMSANPSIAAGTTAGQKLLLIGRDDTNTITIPNGNGVSLNGDITLGADDTLFLYWDGTNWSEISRRR